MGSSRTKDEPAMLKSMNLEKALLLTPSHCYDEFPIHHDDDEADDLLASWTALWHPSILRLCQQYPTWAKIDEQNGDLSNQLLVVPQISDSDANSVRARAASGDVYLVDGKPDRNELLKEVFAQLGCAHDECSEEVASDFMALGYCFLQTELLTRNMRYSSNLSDGGFQVNLDAAVESAFNDNVDATRASLQACFDMLTQEREHYYAVDVFLLDISLVSANRPSDLRRQLRATHKTNLLISGRDVELLSNDEDITTSLKPMLQSGDTTIIGGEFDELRTSLVSSESLLRQLREGMNLLSRILDFKPRVFGRRRFGLTPVQPSILERLGFTGALHATFDDGRFPEATQTKSRWEGTDGAGLSAIMRAPLDATRSKTFLNLAGSISESMDMDHVATRCLAHPAGHTCCWFEELLRVSRYTNALGRFVTADEYFEESYDPGTHEQYNVGNYHSPYLRQAVDSNSTDPISSVVRYWRHEIRSYQIQTLAFLVAMVDSDSIDDDDVQAGLAAAELSGDESSESEGINPELCERLSQRLAKKLIRNAKHGDGGLFALNLFSFPTRQLVQTKPGILTSEKPVYAVHYDDEKQQTVFDTSAMGFSYLASPSSIKPQKRQPSIVEDGKLRNEFLECDVDSKSGGLRFIRSYRSRTNQLSQQLSIRLGRPASPQHEAPYAKMVADKIESTRSSPILGEIVSRGRLLGEDESHLGDFTQTVSLERGSRVIRIRVHVDTDYEFNNDAWNSYLCSRFAWPNEATDLVAGVLDRSMPTTSRRLEAPLFIDLDDAANRTTIISGGIPFHRRIGARNLDSILVVKGETAQEFEFGIGIDLANPIRDAKQFLANPITSFDTQLAAPTQTGWLFHIDAKNVVATSWHPTVENETRGFRVRLMETSGRATQVSIKSFRALSSARKVDFENNTLSPCAVKDDAILVNLDGHEWSEVEGLFS